MYNVNIQEDSNKSLQHNDIKQSKHFKQELTPEDLKIPESLKKKLPLIVKKFLDYSSPLSDVPDEFLLMPFIGIAGALIGQRRYIRMGGIEVYPVIWTVLFAGSSTFRKSTGIKIAKKPFNSILNKWNEEFEMKIKDWKSEKKKADENNEDFRKPMPVKKTLYCSDGFSELTFWESLSRQGSFVSTATEFVALYKELTLPRNGMKDLALSIFDAENSIRRHTRSGGDIEIRNPVWCIVGATTLSNFQEALTSNEKHSGLLQRILPICIEERTKPFQALTELNEPDEELFDEITRKIQVLVDIDTRAVSLTENAKKDYTIWSHRLQATGEELSNRIDEIGGFISRLDVYTLKFALIFQQLENPEEPISKQNMCAAIELSRWLLVHIVYMLDQNYVFNPYYGDRIKLRDIIAKQPSKVISRTDLMNLSHFDKKQLDRAVESDIEAGIIEVEMIDTGGRPLYKYHLKDNA